MLRDQALAVIRAVGVETGGSNIQFAVNPDGGEVVVIEMNPRVSRSSALASKATGFPIAKIAARLAVGYALEEIPNDITRRTPASFEPTIDYAVVKIPRFAFEKFPMAEGGLTTQMKSVGEAMAIGRTFKQAFMKALRSRELDAKLRPPADDDELLARLEVPSHDRYELLWEALRRGHSTSRSCTPHRRSIPGSWTSSRSWSRPSATRAPARSRARRTSASRDERGRRHARASGSRPACGRRSSRSTPARRSSRRRRPTSTPPTSARSRAATRATPSCAAARGPSVVILGSGPNRIGQGIEFDYCCVHAAMTVRETGRDAVMVNCNPETVSTDYDTSTRLYFEPLTVEDVLEVVDVEQPEGVIVQFGGPDAAADRGRPAGGRRAAARARRWRRSTSPRTAGRFGGLLDELGHPGAALRRRARRGRGAGGRRAGSAFRCWCGPRTCSAAARWSSATREEDLERYLERLEGEVASRMYPLLLDRFLENAIELDVDALADGEDVYVAGHHAARRGGGRALGRLRLRAAAAEPRRGDAGGGAPPDARRSRSGSAWSGS